MKNQLLFILLLFICIVYSQDRTMVSGKIQGDSVSLGQIHIYNINARKGTISYKNGFFNLRAKVKDTLLLTSIQFSEIYHVITKMEIANKAVIISVKEKATKLKEVIVKSTNLTGSILNDRKKVPKDFEQYTHYKISLKNVNLDAPGNISTPDDRKLPDPLQTSETVNSIDFIGLFRLATKGIRKQRKHKLLQQKLTKELPEKIKTDLGESFFTNVLKIPKTLIDDFLIYCQNKQILPLNYPKNKMEVLEKMIILSKSYLKTIKP